MIYTAKQLVKVCGIVVFPNPNPGISPDPKVAYTVQIFYCNNIVSVIMPGERTAWQLELVIQKTTGKMAAVKQSAEVYAELKELHLDLKFGFLKYAD
jgi:hypothetical protein